MDIFEALLSTLIFYLCINLNDYDGLDGILILELYNLLL